MPLAIEKVSGMAIAVSKECDGCIAAHAHAAVLHGATPAEAAEAKRLTDRMADRALRLGGTVTGEHGIGMGKLDYMEREHGAGWDVMGQIKRTLDPAGLLDPGKMVRGN